MSIYATLWALRFPTFGQFHVGCDWVTVIAQSVPAHVGAEAPDPYASFLPPFPGSVAAGIRAVVFALQGTAKGTDRSAQEYSSPLLVLSGTEYAAVPFPTLHASLSDALRGCRPRLTIEALRPDGSAMLVFEDGSVVTDIVEARKPKD